MKTVLVVGAGKSSLFLVEYLLRGAEESSYTVVVADADVVSTEAKIAGHSAGRSLVLDVTDAAARKTAVESADVVCSLLPPALHTLLAYNCLEAGKPLITASYVSDEMRALDAAARDKGLLFMCEMGLDPGIDHMSAMEIAHRIKAHEGHVIAFRSYCGGLVAPDDAENSWRYKFTWNPRNIILAGRDGAGYMDGGREVHVPYAQLFDKPGRIDVTGIGPLEYYYNRDSLAYPRLYKLEDAPTFLRATLRYPGFIQGWHALVSLGLTNPADKHFTRGLTARQWTAAVTNLPADHNLEASVSNLIHPVTTEHLPAAELSETGIFSDERLDRLGESVSSADILLYLLSLRWALRPTDRDLVVMQHEFDWESMDGASGGKITSSLVLKGEGGERTAMAKTVGLPMGILARMILRGVEGLPTGVCIPTMPEVYIPVLQELAAEGIVFSELEQ